MSVGLFPRKCCCPAFFHEAINNAPLQRRIGNLQANLTMVVMSNEHDADRAKTAFSLTRAIPPTRNLVSARRPSKPDEPAHSPETPITANTADTPRDSYSMLVTPSAAALPTCHESAQKQLNQNSMLRTALAVLIVHKERQRRLKQPETVADDATVMSGPTGDSPTDHHVPVRSEEPEDPLRFPRDHLNHMVRQSHLRIKELVSLICQQQEPKENASWSLKFFTRQALPRFRRDPKLRAILFHIGSALLKWRHSVPLNHSSSSQEDLRESAAWIRAQLLPSVDDDNRNSGHESITCILTFWHVLLDVLHVKSSAKLQQCPNEDSSWLMSRVLADLADFLSTPLFDPSYGAQNPREIQSVLATQKGPAKVVTPTTDVLRYLDRSGTRHYSNSINTDRSSSSDSNSTIKRRRVSIAAPGSPKTNLAHRHAWYIPLLQQVISMAAIPTIQDVEARYSSRWTLPKEHHPTAQTADFSHAWLLRHQFVCNQQETLERSLVGSQGTHRQHHQGRPPVHAPDLPLQASVESTFDGTGRNRSDGVATLLLLQYVLNSAFAFPYGR
jgi:hypothetical protein